MTGRKIISIRLEDFPDGATAEGVAEYCRDALRCWGGSFRPEDPMFHGLRIESISVGNSRFTVPEEDR